MGESWGVSTKKSIAPGSGVKAYSAAQIGVASSFISVVGAGLSGYSIGETIDSYYYGYVTYRQKYGK